jgi:S-adenosylmethionine:tRNA ribosyltransferase-isomerase
MNLSDFDFHLPENLIATRPARPRTAARLLLAEAGRLEDWHVQDLVDRKSTRLNSSHPM